MSIVVVGSSGFIGRRLMTFFGTRSVSALGASSADGSGIDPASGRLSSGFFIPEGVEAVVYLAQSPYFRQCPANARHLIAVNVETAVDVAERARAAGVRRFLYASSGNIYAPSFSSLSEADPLRRDEWYALSKVHAEEALALFVPGMTVVSMRLFAVYGPGQRSRLVSNLIDAVAAGREIVLEPNPLQPSDEDGMRISLTFIEDAVRVIAALAQGTATSGALNIAGEEAPSIREIATMAGRILRRPVRFAKGNRARNSDLVADVARLRVLGLGPFTGMQQGLEASIACMAVDDHRPSA